MSQQAELEYLRSLNKANNDWGQRLWACLGEILLALPDVPAELVERANKLLAEE